MVDQIIEAYNRMNRSFNDLLFASPSTELPVKVSAIDQFIIRIRQHVKKLAAATRQRSGEEHRPVPQIKHHELPRERDEHNVLPLRRERKPHRIEREYRRGRSRGIETTAGGGGRASGVSL